MKMNRALASVVTGLLAGSLLTAQGAPIYVDLDWTGAMTGGPSTPFNTIYDAVNAANQVAPGTRGAPATVDIRIAAGAYKDIANGGLEDYSLPANPVSPTLITGGGYKLGWATVTPDQAVLVNVYGGYAGWDGGSGFDWTEGSRVPRSTVIDLNGAESRAFYNNHGTHTSQGTLFDGLTIQNGNVTGNGGAILSMANYMVYERINNCLFENNVASGQGGAAYLGSDLKGYIRDSEFVDNQGTAGGAVFATHIGQISNTIFRGNTGTVGGAVAIDQQPGANVILGCTFENNQATQNGGAFYGRTASATRPYQIVSSVFTGNSAPSGAAIGGAGGLYHQGSGPVYIENSLITGNTGGAAVHVEGGNNPTLYTVDMLNSTVADNAGDGVRGRFTASDAKTLRVRNSIIVDNGGYGIYKMDLGESDALTYNDVFGNTLGGYYQATAGTGSVSVDPVFVDAAGGDYRLMASSPLLDAALWDGVLTADLLGDTRVTGDGMITMGAYELAVPEPGSLALALLALGGVAMRRRRRQ